MPRRGGYCCQRRVLLPAASFAETTGTYTNTERRIQMVQAAIQPQGDSRPEWKILCNLASRMCTPVKRRLVDGICPSWDYANTAAIMDEIASLTPIYAGVSHERLERGDHLMWPVESAEHPGTPTLLRVGMEACSTLPLPGADPPA